MYRLTVSPSAAKFFDKAEKSLQRKLDRCFQQLKVDPHHHNNIKRLSGPLAGELRFRVGNYRVVYNVDEVTEVVYVSMIAHRRDVYE
jgi:mRNA interferase RelE/StbE